MKKQARKTKHEATLEMLAPPPRGTAAWLGQVRYGKQRLITLSLADGTLLACALATDYSAATLRRAWQQRFKSIIIQTGKAPRAPKHCRVAPIGTAFQRAVWLAVSFIPSGCVAAYSDIALAIGRPRATRAVGNAVGKNPLAPLVPCHRVIAANGQIGGYTGKLTTKRRLLQAEGTVL